MAVNASGIKDSLDDFLVRSANAFKFKGQLQIVAARKAVDEKFSGLGRQPTVKELGDVYEIFCKAADTGEWDKVEQKDWKKAAFVLFWDKSKYLPSDKNFNIWYEAWIQSQKGSKAWKRLIYAYILNFDHYANYPLVFKRWAELINSFLNKEDSPRTLRVWGERNKTFDLFNQKGDVRRAAQGFLVHCAAKWEVFVEATGLSNELEKRGLIISVGRELIKMLAKSDVEQAQNIRKFFDINDGIRAPELRSALIDALLIPWEDDAPDAKYKKELQKWLMDKFGDPRLVQSRQRGWAGVSQDAVDVFKRWLVGETLDQFFAIIDELALEEHWRYRKKFWKAYFEAEYIRDAWVVLGTDAQNYAKKAFGNSISAGRIVGGQHQSNHSVLLIQIDDYVFSEWSHNGKCRAWKRGERHCPEFHRAVYDAGDFRTPSLQIVESYQQDGIVHAGSENYSWQRKLADFIRRRTGAKVEQRKYTVSARD